MLCRGCAELVLGVDLLDVLKLHALELPDAAEREFVDLVGAEEHFDALVLKRFEKRRGTKTSLVLAGEVIDRLATFACTSFVVRKACPVLGHGALESQEFQKRLAVLPVGEDALFDLDIEERDEGLELFGVDGRQLFEFAEKFFKGGLLDGHHDAVVLKHLAAHVEREIVRIDDAAHKAEVGRKDL